MPVDGPRSDKVVGGDPAGARASGALSLVTFFGQAKKVTRSREADVQRKTEARNLGLAARGKRSLLLAPGS
ncbi:MAG TPA: hypothetical protein ENK00_00845 [Chromatiales bacterium]|nr:hypothetical protein [Chromatiales bacterium]